MGAIIIGPSTMPVIFLLVSPGPGFCWDWRLASAGRQIEHVPVGFSGVNRDAVVPMGHDYYTEELEPVRREFFRSPVGNVPVVTMHEVKEFFKSRHKHRTYRGFNVRT